MKADKSNYYGYNRNLQPFANSLRKNMTKAEACLWKYALKARQIKGHQFRRQRPVLNYIADFMCKELKLIIEVDGITHTYEGAAERDAVRQRRLEEAGFIVIRFLDEEVLKHMSRVIEDIEHVVEGLENALPLSPRGKNTTPLHPPAGDNHPQPPPAGDRL